MAKQEKAKAQEKASEFAVGDEVILLAHKNERGTIYNVHEGGHLADVELSGGRKATVHTSNLEKA